MSWPTKMGRRGRDEVTVVRRLTLEGACIVLRRMRFLIASTAGCALASCAAMAVVAHRARAPSPPAYYLGVLLFIALRTGVASMGLVAFTMPDDDDGGGDDEAIECGES